MIEKQNSSERDFVLVISELVAKIISLQIEADFMQVEKTD